ncbi:MAG: isopenicillin N synthase family dioxygenase [Acidimicrobiales bacterium]
MAPSNAVPTIDLGRLPPSSAAGTAGALDPPRAVVDQVADAAHRFGFFQVVNHGVPSELIDRVWEATTAFFAQPTEAKRRLLRTKQNTRGYHDRELTKNARDLKEVLDLAHVPFPELADDDPRNHHAVDGVNRWPDIEGFRATMIDYLQACEGLSLWLLAAFSAGLGERPDRLATHFGPDHTSFVRLNHYPLADPLSSTEADSATPLGDMALHHHSDAGALTVLLQDDVGGLQVEHEQRWIDVEPIPGGLVVNTGDMMQVWSNDRYRAALHRVAPRTNRARSSLPYFFNPSYGTDYGPLPGSIDKGHRPHYRPINWGHFRQARADGDFADYGAEIQITDYRL